MRRNLLCIQPALSQLVHQSMICFIIRFNKQLSPLNLFRILRKKIIIVTSFGNGSVWQGLSFNGNVQLDKSFIYSARHKKWLMMNSSVFISEKFCKTIITFDSSVIKTFVNELMCALGFCQEYLQSIAARFFKALFFGFIFSVFYILLFVYNLNHLLFIVIFNVTIFMLKNYLQMRKLVHLIPLLCYMN